MAEASLLHWRDLAGLTPAQRAAELLLPLPWLILALAFAQCGWFAAGAVATALFFTAGLRLTHDGYHRNLGLSPAGNDRLLFLLSVLLGGALHAIEHTHLHHHRHCLAEDDLEGRISHLGLAAAMLRSPLYPLQIHWHTWRRGTPRQRRWMRRELLAIALVQCLVWSSGSAALQWIAFCLLCANAAVPLVGIWSVHRGCARDPGRARSSRSRLLARLSFNMLYHHEHHRYPGVPARHLGELARRLAAHGTAPPALPLLGGLQRAAAPGQADADRDAPQDLPSAATAAAAARSTRPHKGPSRAGRCRRPPGLRRRQLRLAAFALLPLLAGCGHRHAGTLQLDVCALAGPAVATLIAEPLALPGQVRPPLAGSCQFRAVDDAQHAPQIEVQLYTEAAAARTRLPLAQTLRLILAEAGNTYGGADILAFDKVAETNVAYGEAAQPRLLVLAEGGVILEIQLRGVYRQSAVELAIQLWKTLKIYRPPAPAGNTPSA
ncbi:fatty acid desaturase [Tahibacter harae]|uniref:Fatty acid desaturase n=1 Tax=Tahibacter harae TaxID=2963937 RepID=A0ABT1QRW4_9GAMM|nr:fatty acid desaturase [Tahibacter harae]MCQ4165024.1 fatty acid desaturase [Tahibacter harae]